MILVIRILLAITLLGSLFLAGRRIYRNLPADNRSPISATSSVPGASLRLVVRNTVAGATLQSPVEIYRFNLVEARRQFDESPQLAKQFEDFLARRMHDVVPLKVDADRNGLATATLTSGVWWLRATAILATGEQIEWRLPIVISNRDLTIDLSFENAYERTKQF